MFKVTVALVTLCCLYAQVCTQGTKNPKNTWSSRISISSIIKPINYKISITPYFDDEYSEKYLTFEGTAEIEFKVRKRTRKISLRSQKLSFIRGNCTLKNANGKIVDDFHVTFEENTTFVHLLRPQDKFFAGKFLLNINYTGTISNETNTGIFRTFYYSKEYDEVPYILTYMDQSYASLVLPYFYQTKYKATFDMIINHSKNYRALSSMPIKNVTYDGLTAKTTFMRTPPMPVYQLAFVVSNFQNISIQAKNFTVWSTKELLNKADVVLNLSSKIYQELEKYTNVSLEIGKLDQVILPLSEETTMHYPGLIVHGSNDVLEPITSLEYFSCAKNVAHGLVEQWLGNVAILKSKKYIWLVESIASYMAYYLLEKVEPRLKAMNQFIADELPISSIRDWNKYKIVQKKTPELSDTSYKDTLHIKGAFIVRMLQHILTESVFQKGLQNYLKKGYYANANLDNFYQAFQEILDENKSDLKIKPVLDSWLYFRGYPLVTIKRNYSTNEITLRQEIFFVNITNDKKKSEKQNWNIPINYASKGNLDFNNTLVKFWLTDSSMTVNTNVKPQDWIIINKQFTSFCIVNYDKHNWKLIIDYLSSPNWENVHLLNRVQLLKDAFILAQTERLSIRILLQLYNYLKKETNCLAWYPGLLVLDWLDVQLANTELHSLLQKYALNTMQLMLETIGLEDNEKDDAFKLECRAEVLSVACKMGHSSCKEISIKKYKKWRNDADDSFYELENTLICYGLQHTQDLYESYDFFFDELEIGDVNYRLTEVLDILGCMKDVDVLKYYLLKLKDSSSYAEMNILLLSMLRQNKIDTVFDFLIKDLPSPEFDKNVLELQDVFEELAKKLPTVQTILGESQFMKFFGDAINRGMKESEKRVKWLKKNTKITRKNIKKFLRSK